MLRSKETKAAYFLQFVPLLQLGSQRFKILLALCDVGLRPLFPIERALVNTRSQHLYSSSRRGERTRRTEASNMRLAAWMTLSSSFAGR